METYGRTLFNPTEVIPAVPHGRHGAYSNLNFAHTPLLPGDKVTIASVGSPWSMVLASLPEPSGPQTWTPKTKDGLPAL